nr:hypothetical protein [Tanacetum cinerariifolium]
MITLAEFMIIAGANNHPPMLEKSMYDSWKSSMELYIDNRENERMILNSVLNGPLVWPTIVEENGTTRTKKYEKLPVTEKLQADYDLKATNIFLQGLPPDVYDIINHHKVAKKIWDTVKLLMQGTKLSLQEKEYSGLVVPMFSQGDDLIACLNKAMAFLSAVAASRFPSTNNQLKTSYNSRNHATIRDGRVTGQSYASTAIKPKRLRNAAWFKEKEMLVEAQESGQILDEEKLAFLADPGILDHVISEVPHSKSYHHDMDNQNFGKHFVPQQELSVEQAFWLQTSHPNTDQSDISPIKIEAPKEFPKITPNAITEGKWGFEHTKAVFLNEIIPFLKTLNDIFNVFNKDLLNEVTEVQTVFNQMEAVVEQCSIDKQCFEIHKKQFFLENDRLLYQIMSQDVMICVMNSTVVFGDYVNLEMKKSESCNKCLDLESELVKRKNMVE